MKKEIMATVLAAAMVFSVAACDNSKSKKKDKDDKDVEIEEEEEEEDEEDESEETEEETSATETPTEGPTETTTETSAASNNRGTVDTSSSDWFDKSGLKITQQGDFTLTAQMIFYSDNSVQDIEIPCNIEITETTEGAPEGYKYVFGVFTVDYSEYDDLYENWDFVSWFSAFDRYTGTSFESDPSATYGDSQTPGVIPIEYDGKTYDITYLFGYTKKSGVATISVTVTCPEDYEGTVFQCGSGPWEVVDEYSQMDLSEKLYTIDELPYYDSNGYPYFYFSNTNK